MTQASDSKEILAGVYENGGQTTIVYLPGLDESSISDCLREVDGSTEIIHAGENGNRRMTVVSVMHNHFGKFRHDRAERVFAAIRGTVESTGTKITVNKTPKDFSS